MQDSKGRPFQPWPPAAVEKMQSLEAELVAANALLAKAVSFVVGNYLLFLDSALEPARWRAVHQRTHKLCNLGDEWYWPTAAEAVAAAEKAREP